MHDNILWNNINIRLRLKNGGKSGSADETVVFTAFALILLVLDQVFILFQGKSGRTVYWNSFFMKIPRKEFKFLKDEISFII